MLFSIVTPSIGHPLLARLLLSVNSQSHDLIEHIIVIDGPHHVEKVQKILDSVPPRNAVQRYVVALPFATGIMGYLGHKIYASITQICRGDYILMIDEDNFISHNHVENFRKLIEKKQPQWLFSLRMICDEKGDICPDLCESLGSLHPVYYKSDSFLIDTGCYCIHREIMTKHSGIWNAPGYNNDLDPDRQFGKLLMTQYPRYFCTMEPTFHYQMASRPGSVQKELFIKGNEVMRLKYGDKNPIKRKHLYLFHFDRQHTDMLLEHLYEKKNENITYKEWQLNLMDGISDDYIILNGFVNPMPAGSTAIFHICFIDALPVDIINRHDIIKIHYTIESPNIRHQKQWDKTFLNNFTIVVSYWTDLFRERTHNTIPFQYTHRLNFNNPKDLELIQKNKDDGRSVCMVLENRPFREDYKVNSTVLHAQDYLRLEYARNIPNMICYGSSWRNVSNITTIEIPDKQNDTKRVIDYMQNHTFTLIIENCDAQGYVSEKFYDALVVGSIPIYYGNIIPEFKIPDDIYIDLKKIPPTEIHGFLQNLSDSDINNYRERIYACREELLKKVSVNSYARTIMDLYDKYCSSPPTSH